MFTSTTMSNTMLSRFVIGQTVSKKHEQGIISHVSDNGDCPIGKEAEFEVIGRYLRATDYSVNPAVHATECTEREYLRIRDKSLGSKLSEATHGVIFLLQEVNTGLVGTFFVSHKQEDLLSLFSKDVVKVRVVCVSTRHGNYHTLTDVQVENLRKRKLAIQEFNWKQDNPNGSYEDYLDSLSIEEDQYERIQ